MYSKVFIFKVGILVEYLAYVLYAKYSIQCLDSKIVHNKLHYFVDWLGYNNWIWELVENLVNATKIVAKFHHWYPDKSHRSCITTCGTCCQWKEIVYRIANI